MKRHSILLCVFALFAAIQARATEAISLYSSSTSIVGYANGGAGFAFSPSQSVFLTSLGFGGASFTASSEPFDVTLWNSSGSQLASAVVTGGSPLFNATRYETVPPLLLNAGQTYYIGAVGVNTDNWYGDVILVPPHSTPTGMILVSPEITFLGGATGLDGGVFPRPVDIGAFYVGANFQYVIPEPSAFALSGLGVAMLLIFRRRSLS